MSHRHGTTLPPETFETPDAGFMAATGAYVAAVLVAAVLTVAAAVGASVATVLGGVSTAATVGLIAGGVASSFVAGLPERLGQRRRRLLVPFVPPAVLVGIALVALSLPVLPPVVALGAGTGAAITLVVAFAIVTMARTRYARVMAPEDPIAATTRLKPNQDRRWFALGVLCFGGYGAWVLATGGLTSGNSILWVIAWGVFALYRGVELRFGFRGPDRDGWAGRVLDTDRLAESTEQWLPELRVHEAGIAIVRPMQRRFVPWETVSDVRLTADELVVERPRRFDIRCDRAAIDDPDGVYEAMERARSTAANDVLAPRTTTTI
jgi:MFS family permease